LCVAYNSEELSALLSRAVADEYIAGKLVALYSTAMKVMRTNPLERLVKYYQSKRL
jgi:hypothetical protein